MRAEEVVQLFGLLNVPESEMMVEDDCVFLAPAAYRFVFAGY